MKHLLHLKKSILPNRRLAELDNVEETANTTETDDGKVHYFALAVNTTDQELLQQYTNYTSFSVALANARTCTKETHDNATHLPLFSRVSFCKLTLLMKKKGAQTW